MKKYLFTMSAVAMLFATSCQNELDMPQGAGETATVAFNISTPEIATRAYSDGQTATHLQYAVYKADGTILSDLTNTQGEIHGSTTVDLKLTTGNTYTVVFWAAAPNAPYAVNFGGTLDAAKMDVAYTNATSNDENRDAFYAVKEFTVNGAMSVDVDLYRPFAQINIGTSDYADSKSAGYIPTQSAVTVKGLGTTLNFNSGKVSGKAEARVFGEAVIDKNETFPVEGYEYLAMNYVLVDAVKSLVDVEFTYSDANGDAKTRTVGSVPVQRNYRTNIYGQLLTSDVDINVEIVPVYNEPAHGLAELQYAALNGGEVTLTEDVVLTTPLEVYGEMTLNLGGHTITTALKETDRHHYAIDNYSTLTIEGEGAINARGVQNFGTMTIDGKVTITNVDTNGGSAIWNEGKLIINDGTFTTNDQAGSDSYGSALNTQEGGEAIINGGEFIANSQLTYAVLNYGTTTINYAVVKGKHGAVASDNIAKTTIYGGSFELMENPGVSDHCTYLVNDIRGGKFTLGKNTDCGAQVFYGSTIAEGYGVYADGEWYEVMYTGGNATVDAVVNNATELNAAINNDKIVIVLAEGNYGTINATSGITYIGTANAKVDCVNLNGADNVTLRNITFDAATAKLGYDGSGKAKQYANIITDNNGGKNTPSKGSLNLVIDGCTFEGTFANGGAAIAFTDQSRSGGFSGNITIKNCTFDTKGSYYDIYGHYTGNGTNGYGDFVIENNTFKSARTQGLPVYLGRYASSTPVVVKGNRFETVSSLEDAVYVQDHSSYGVSVDASNNTFAN